MPIKMRRVYLETIRDRYLKGTRREKTTILTEFCLNCGYERKYAIRILNRRVEPRLNKPGPRVKYGSQVVRHLLILWDLMNRMCSKKMKAAFKLWLPFYKDTDSQIINLLYEISPSTIDRLLRPYKNKKLKGLSSTKPSMIKSRIPIKLLDSEVTRPGYVEADTVAHCGESLSGTFAYTLTVVDLYSAWTANRGIWSKSADKVLDQIKHVECDLPFDLLGFACDNGTEFINDDLYQYLFNRPSGPIDFVRRRPYKKNDSAHVEQKNFTHVREIFGYRRFEFEELVPLMNEIYRVYWNPIQNFFTPVLKLKEKIREGAKIKKIYDEPKTPCQRLLDSPDVPQFIKNRLKQHLKTKNPFFLKGELDKKLKIFWETLDMYEQKVKFTYQGS